MKATSKNVRAKIAEVRSLLEDLASEMEGYIEERSDSWQESEAGEEYQTLLDGVNQLANDCEALEGD